MNCIKLLGRNVLKLSSIPRQSCNLQFKRFRKPSPCDVCLFPPEKKPCFDLRNVSIEIGGNKHGKIIRSFLENQYWPREPSVVGLWMCHNSSYLDILSDKYAHSGDRFLAWEYIPRTGENKLIGVCVANKVFPWAVDELEEWAHYTASRPERNRMYFCAHCIRSPNLFKKFNVAYLYDVEVLGTAAEVSGQGVGTMLLQRVLNQAEELRHPLVQVVAVSQYTAKICEKCEMKMEWTMDYSEFIDDSGQRVFFPRSPHQKVSIYVKYFDPKIGGRQPCLPPF
ncbi:uncharacterized protein LOC123691742 [Colias croceus]|uniref:uncharacterized protein LOC123691742 n=1 Tax=Colias crocea TaxID=72248 RepID=UPI001E280669|nr:uncharacterized protein LOC123691742 [Colias croceus]